MMEKNYIKRTRGVALQSDCEEEYDEAISFVRLPRRKAPRNGEVGGSSRRE